MMLMLIRAICCKISSFLLCALCDRSGECSVTGDGRVLRGLLLLSGGVMLQGFRREVPVWYHLFRLDRMFV